MHLRLAVLLALPTLLLSQSQDEPTAQASATPQEAVQSRMAGTEETTGTGYWSRCARHGSDSQRQERRQPEPTQQQRAAETDSSHQPEKQSYSGDTHHSEEQVVHHASYAPLPYQGNLAGFGYITHPRRAYYEGTAMNYPYQHSAAQYPYSGHSY